MKIMLLILVFLLTGCEKKNNAADMEMVEWDSVINSESEALLDAFLEEELAAVYEGEEESIMISDLLSVDDEVSYYSVGERIDLDNDGEKEQIVDGPYGGFYFDARDEKVYVLTQGEGTSGVLSYVNYDDAIWIVHSDTTHAGRQMFWLTRYDGAGKAADEFQLSAEYWYAPNSEYDKDSDFTYRDKKISMQEYETLRKEIIGW